jgi:8-oxo-dGTP pyrophosphatase MutT (NUDIX family)
MQSATEDSAPPKERPWNPQSYTSNYNYHHHMRLTSAGALILAKGSMSVLLVHQKDCGLWSLPKGSALPHEKLEDTMKRECFEESSMDLNALKYREQGRMRFKRYLIFVIHLLQHPPPLTPRDTSEINDLRWFRLSDLPQDMNCVTRFALNEFLTRHPTLRGSSGTRTDNVWFRKERKE